MRILLSVLLCAIGCGPSLELPGDAGASDRGAHVDLTPVDTPNPVVPARPPEPSPEASDDAADAARVQAPEAAPPWASLRVDPPPSCVPPRWVLSGTVRNARDLSGVPGAAGGTIPCGLWYRGPALAGLTDQGCAEVAALGLRTAVDLRTDSERESAPQAGCVAARAVSAPMSPVSPLAATDAIRVAFGVLGNPRSYPVLIHCSRGTDRTGAVVALLLLAIGTPEYIVAEEYALSAQAGQPTDPAALDALFSTVRAAGGIDAFLRALGVTPDQLETARMLAAGAIDNHVNSR